MAALCQKAAELLQFSLSANQLAFSTPDETLRQNARMAGVKSGRELKHLLESHLDHARLTAGDFTLREKDFHLRRLMGAVIEKLSTEAQGKNLELAFVVEPGMPGWVRGDAQRLRQMLGNMVRHTLSTTADGLISLHAREAKEQWERDDAFHLRVSVTYSGSAQPPEMPAAIQQAGHPGAGQCGMRDELDLDLAICKQLATAMGGFIQIENAPSPGASGTMSVCTVEVVLRRVPPQADEQWEGDEPQAEPETSRDSLRVLLAEDNPAIAFFLTEVFQDLPHTLSVAWSGKEAIERVALGGIDLLLMDVQMPGMDGLEATRRIRRGEAGPEMADVPIIAVSTHSQAGIWEQCSKAGMSGFLAKPIVIAKLVEILDTLAAKSGFRASHYGNTTEAASSAPKKPLIRSVDSPASRERLLDLFKQTVSSAIAAITNAYSRNDTAMVARQAHNIVNSAVVIGAENLEKLARRIEAAAMAGELSDCAGDFRQLLAFTPEGTRPPKGKQAGPGDVEAAKKG